MIFRTFTAVLSIFLLTLALTSCNKEFPPQKASVNDYAVDEMIPIPQIYFYGSAFYSEQDKAALQSKVIKPLTDYYNSIDQKVVAILIDSDNKASENKNEFYVEVVIAVPGQGTDAVLYGFVHSKINGEIPEWQPETVPENYQG